MEVGRGKEREKQSRTLRTRKKEIARTNPHRGEQSKHKSNGPIDGTAGTLRRAEEEHVWRQRGDEDEESSQRNKCVCTSYS